MRKGVIIILLLIVAILSGISLLFDYQIVRFAESIRNSFMDYAFLSIGLFTGSNLIIFFFLTSLFLWQERKRRWVLPLWIASFISVVVSFLLKVLVARPRPFHEYSISVLQIAFHFMRNNFNTWNFSFPSLQTVLVFSALPIISKEFKKFRYVWIVFAILVGLSRTYFGVHYLSDVLGGAVIGYLIGWAMVVIEEKYNFGKKLVNKLKLSK